MDPIDAWATHSQQYFTRLENSEKCFETETGPLSLVHIIDISALAKLQPGTAAPLRRHDCANLKALDDCLRDPKNADYSSRLM
jgi:hypothetical protein